jgi:hypothetical protein
VALAALIVAVVSGTLAVLTFGWTIGWSIWQHRQTTRPKLFVAGSFAVLGTDPPERVFETRAVNDGLVPVTLSVASSEVEGVTDQVIWLNYLSQSPAPLPHLVPPGEHWRGLIDAGGFRQGLASLPGVGDPPWRVRVSVKDLGHRFYHSDWFEVGGG